MPRSQTAAPPRSPRLRVQLFGAFQLEREPVGRASRVNGRPQSQPQRLPARKTESLLAYLICNPEPYSRVQLAGLLSGDLSDELTRRAVRRAPVLLRQALAPP